MLLLVQVAQKPLFMLIQPAFDSSMLASMGQVICAGFSMDLSMSAYLMCPLLLWLLLSIWVGGRGMTVALKSIVWFEATLTGLAFCLDMMLYPYWGFRLDTTPIFYFTSSPAAALASVAWWHALLGIIGTLVLIVAVYKLYALSYRLVLPLDRCPSRVRAGIVFLVIGGLLIIPIRGGVTVSTMSPGRAYFGEDMRLNNAAVNPLFNFIYSAMHADRLAESFRYYADADAESIVQQLSTSREGDSTLYAVDGHPDVYLVILESFSSHLMPSQGGEPIAVRLDSMARTGLLFSNFYAESFRTDRALATILSAYPALPTTSVMKFSNKFGNMPSPTRMFTAAGYHPAYYYGGDINFTNLKAFLLAGGFEDIVADSDFPVTERLSKWGVHDHILFRRVLADAKECRDVPRFTVVQTSSSHEPFDVPYARLADERANAFAYADSCLGDFVDSLAASPRWANTLVAIVPDHWGAYPQGLTDLRARHHVPFVIVGGALRGRSAVVDVIGSQSAVMPTLMAMLGISTEGLYRPRNMLSTSSNTQYAWLTEPDRFELITDAGDAPHVVYVDNSANVSESDAMCRAKAFVQSLYSDLNSR